MEGSIIVLSLKKGMSPKEKNEFCHYFYGHDTSSWRGGYRYHGYGLLDGIPHRKIVKSVIIIGLGEGGKLRQGQDKIVPCRDHGPNGRGYQGIGGEKSRCGRAIEPVMEIQRN
ncbi:MAG: hypothetical protein M1476_02925 [Candidatus Thermoplasmatota archaeon]|nr:hypothetical protein [Candidatus Thermoplasmatota archaeon]